MFKVFLITVFVQTYGASQSHVVKCLNGIALRHFTPGMTLVIINSHQEQITNLEQQRRFLTTNGVSSPRPAEFNSLNSALEDLHQQEMWPLIAYTTCYKVKHGTRSKHGAYILLLSTPDLIREMRNQLTALKLSPEWNPRANFVVVLTQRCLLSVKHSDLGDEILTELWNWKINDVIVLVPTQTFQLQTNEKEINKRSSKTSISEERVPVFDVYTWFPRQASGLCGQVRKAILTNVWVSDGDGGGHFLYDVPLFGHKILRTFNGCPIRVSAFDYSPFFIQDINSEKSKDTISFNDGLEFRLLNTIAKATNISLTFKPIPAGDDLYGRPLQNGSWTGVLGQVLGGTSDVAMCGVYYICHLSNDFECSTP
jgi:hypothetical protein